MISINEAYVDSVAPNAEAAKNGRALVAKNKFLSHHISEDETLIFGQCQGSGSTPYSCSCDFARSDQPTHRCSCPSRQFPCKHCLGLMYAFAQGRTFPKGEIPEDVKVKREKLLARAENAKPSSDKPKKVDKSALAKKIKVQLEGVAILEKMTNDLVRLGIGNMNSKIAVEMNQQAKLLGNSYLPGAQAAVHRYTQLFSNPQGRFEVSKSSAQEYVFAEATEALCRLHAIIKHGRTYLEQRLSDPNLGPATDSRIAAWLGHAWQLSELKEAGLVEVDVELVQLAFNSYDDTARREYVDVGVWYSLGNGKIRLTQNFRPYKAAKYISSDDTFFEVVKTKELCVYPGEGNARVRWDTMESRPLSAVDLKSIRETSVSDLKELIKEVKGQLKNPLGDKEPIHTMRYSRIGLVGEKIVVEDISGERIVLADNLYGQEPKSSELLKLLSSELLRDQTLVAKFHYDPVTRALCVHPLSIVTPNAIVRLTY